MSATQDLGEPRSTDLEELAEYFDRTDAADLPWEESSDLTIARPELEQISVRLPRTDLAELRRRASRSGVGYTTLLRMILRQYLERRPVP